LAQFESDTADIGGFRHWRELQLLRCEPSGNPAAAPCLHRIYYERTGQCYGSPDPVDPSLTTRVLTIMLADEF